MHTDQRHPLGVTDTPEPRSARQTINDMLDAGLLDELMDRVDTGELTLTGQGGFLPEMVKAVLERGLAAGRSCFHRRAGVTAAISSVRQARDRHHRGERITQGAARERGAA